MKKVIVIGCPGSGKSTFARALGDKTRIPVCHLDLLYWNADKTTVPADLFLSRLNDVLATEQWIIDGNFSRTLPLRLEHCDTVFFLDYPTDVCLEGVRMRRGKPRADMPWIEEQEDDEFMQFISRFAIDRRPAILELLQKHAQKRIYVFQNRAQADAFLAADIQRK